MTEEEKSGLTPDSTLQEVFNFIEVPEGGVQAMPVTVHEDPDDTRLAILIRGELTLASFILAKLFEQLQDLADLSAQQVARPPEDAPRIITPR